MRLLRVAATACVLAVAACGTTGSLKTESPEAHRRIADYDQVVVLDLAANDLRPARDAVETAARAQNMAEGRIMFSDAIAEQLTKAGVFQTVSRTPIPGRSLVVTGSIDVWEPGNVATRVVVGFIGKSEFAATVEFRDSETNELLGTVKGDRNSWPLPIGASSNVIQTVEFFANEQARNVSSELIKAKSGKLPAR
jgi:Domain of unknown function (DUF4410)